MWCVCVLYVLAVASVTMCAHMLWSICVIAEGRQLALKAHAAIGSALALQVCWSVHGPVLVGV